MRVRCGFFNGFLRGVVGFEVGWGMFVDVMRGLGLFSFVGEGMGFAVAVGREGRMEGVVVERIEGNSIIVVGSSWLFVCVSKVSGLNDYHCSCSTWGVNVQECASCNILWICVV